MPEALGPAIEGHLMRAILISGVLALVLTAAVASVWWKARRWTRSRTSAAVPSARSVVSFTRTTGPTGSPGEGDPRPEDDRRPDDDQLGSRLIRDAVARAAALRETWDRSYREARSSEGSESAAASTDFPALLEEILREQRETNALLRELGRS
jgi:hypothetical protein